MVTLRDIVEPNTTSEVDRIIDEAMSKAGEDMAEVERKASLLSLSPSQHAPWKTLAKTLLTKP